ncbi:MAG: diguanylate cyclase [Thioalkalispiraceae bacterium]
MAGELNPSVEQWRKKYYDSLGELEDKEQQWAETESFLRILVSRLTLIAETDDHNLNKQLDELRQSIREEQSSHDLKRSIEKISANINKLDTTKGKSKALDPVAPLRSLLDKLQIPDQLRKQERHLRKHLDVADSNDIEQVVQNMVDLIGYINEFSTSKQPVRQPEQADQHHAGTTPEVKPQTEAEEKKSKGFLSSLFSARQADENRQVDATRQKQPTKQKQADATRGDEPASASATATEIQESLAQASNDQAIDIKAACETLIDLIEHFDLPGDLALEANLIKDRLEKCSTRDELISLIEALAELVSEVHQRVEQERSDLESFLKQLTDRLHEIDSDIRGTAKVHTESHQHSQDLNKAVKGHVKGIEDSVSQALDLDSLKRAIQSRVVILRDHMDKFIAEEEQRHQQSSQLIEKLQDRVRNMESETETLKQEVRKKQEEATHDALTGIANRLAYDERIASEIARNKRYQSPLTLLVWDVDNFKSINDTYGHAAGDKVLKVIAKVLETNIRETDFIARYGGEEFVIIMPETTIEAAVPVADKLRKAVEACEFHFKEKRVVITASCGLAELKHNETETQLFERADNALYQAKEAGRNRCLSAS